MNENLSPIPVEAIRLIRGFHTLNLSQTSADAILRGEKTATVIDSRSHVQKGDWLVYFTYDSTTRLRTPHPINSLVFKATFVTDIDHASPHLSLVCFSQKKGYIFRPRRSISEEDTVLQPLPSLPQPDNPPKHPASL